MKPKVRGIIIVSGLCLIAATWLSLTSLGYFGELALLVTSVFVLLRFGLKPRSLWPTKIGTSDSDTPPQHRQCDRFGTLLWLLCAAAIAGLGWWYPNWVMSKNSGPDVDDRSGVVFMIGMPFYFLAVFIALRGVIKLGAAAIRDFSAVNTLTAFAGLLLAVIALSPVVMIVIRISRQE